MEISWESFQKVGKFFEKRTVGREIPATKFPKISVYLARKIGSFRKLRNTGPFITENFQKFLADYFLSNAQRPRLSSFCKFQECCFIRRWKFKK